jgi:hypothetical protein
VAASAAIKPETQKKPFCVEPDGFFNPIVHWVKRFEPLYLFVAPGVSPPALDEPVPLKDVEPLGEPLGSPVGAMPVVPGPVPIIAAPFGVMALFLSLAVGAPELEPPVAEPPELCASAKVLVNASAPASAIVESLMG